MKLSLVFPVLNQFSLATEAITLAVQQLSGDNEVELLILDNGSDTPYEIPEAFKELIEKPLGGMVQINHYPVNMGVYPTFWEALDAGPIEYGKSDVLAFFHSDMIVGEKGWDKRVLEAFEANPKLGLLGFIGSNEIDGSGGRGSGTTSNFQGGKIEKYGVENPKTWTGSPAEAHGMRNREYSKAAVVDGCAMIFRRSVLEQIAQRPEFPPHHFYDRLLSCETIEKGYEVGVLGIECDHISGQTVNQEDAYGDMARAWLLSHGADPSLPIAQPDHLIYQEAERQWLTEYRDQKHMVPFRV